MKKIYLPMILFLLLSNAFIVRAQITYSLLNRSMFLENTADIYLLHPSMPSDYMIRLAYADTPANTGYKVCIFPNQASNAVLVTNDSNEFVKALNAGDPIDETLTKWSDTKKYLYLYNEGTKNFGLWSNVSNKFIGLRMYKNGEYYYGYVQMTIQSGTQPTVKIIDIAYQKTVNKGIKAGQTAGLIHQNLNSDKYFLNDRQLNILTDRTENISISDISGHQLLNSYVKSNQTFDLSKFANGIYLLKITGDDGMMTKKIVLQ
jgi:hypothetical protein